MFEHLRYRSVRVEPKSPAGRKAEEILLLNDEESVKHRDLVLGAIKLIEEKKREIQYTIQAITRRLETATESAQRARLENEKQVAERNYAKMDDYLTRRSGSGTM